MDEDNVHTSVVIELGNEENPVDQNRYKIDFDDLEQPKNYVVDQIFCGENVTVYALFDVSDVANVKSDKQTEVQSIPSSEDYTFHRKNSYTAAINKQCKTNVKVVDSEEEIHYFSSKVERSESFYCLKPFGGKYEISTREEDDSDVKVLFNKDVITKSPKPKNFQVVSRGVNTEVAQSPKVLEEVQKSVSLNFALTKTEDTTSYATSKPYEIIVDGEQSSSSFTSEVEIKFSKKSSPNFVFVPIIMMEDGIQYKNKPSFEKPCKVSLGVNTDPPELLVSNDTEKNVQQLEALKTESDESKAQYELNKTILEEIKTVQWKLNTLIKSLESNNFKLGTGDAVIESHNSQTIKMQENSAEPLMMEAEPIRRNQKMFDQLPIFSPLSFLPPPNKHSGLRSRKKIQNIDRWDMREILLPPTRSNSSAILISGSCSYAAQNIIIDERPKLDRDELNWDEVGNWRGPGTSRSDSNIRIHFDLKHPHALKKSLSFEGKFRIIKNNFSKLEESLNLKRNHPNGETILNGDGVNCMVGDDRAEKTIPELVDLYRNDEKVSANQKKEEIKVNKDKNEDEKCLYQKNNSPSNVSRFVPNTEKIYCSANSFVKTDRNTSPVKKCKNVERKTAQNGKTKNCTDLERTTTVKNYRRPGSSDSSGRNETKNTKTSNCKSKTVEKVTKPEKKDINSSCHGALKQKTMLETKKSSIRSCAESKLHVDRIIKKNNDLDYDYKTSPLTAGKVDTSIRSSRPPVQKRRDSTTPSSGSVTKKNSIFTVFPVKFSEKMNPNGKGNNHQVMASNTSAGIFKGVDEISNASKLSPNPSSVVFELFSNKPTFVEDFYNEFDREFLDFSEKEPPKADPTDNHQSCDNKRKPKVKSVWALTKVLLYEDGTKKLEVLEASSSPPGYCLKISKSNSGEQKEDINEKNSA